MRFSGLLARFPLIRATSFATWVGASAALLACASGTTPPPAVGGDDKPIKDPDELGGKKGPTFYTADTPPPAVEPVPATGGPAGTDGPVKLTRASAGTRALKLLSPGDEPREKRVYAPKVGNKETLSVTSKTTTTMSAGGQGLPGGDVVLPPMHLEIALVVKEVTDGQIKSEFVVTKATAPVPKGGQETVEKYAASVVAAKGAKGTVTTTRGGDAIAVQFDDTAADANKEVVRDALLTPSVPFPAEPIGAGAKWEISQPTTAEGMRFEQITTYELASLAKGKGQVSLTVRVSAPEQDIDVPGAPAQPHLTKLDGTGSGKAAFDLGKVTARSLSLASSSKATVTISMMGTDLAGEMSSRNETKRVGK